ncbi:hypothetical protein LINGRAHAP2_LOCUS35490 [Linum grandiflorum]
MSRETESKKRPPSIVARLMGLDGMPTQPPTYKQERRSSENITKRTTVPTEKPHRVTASSSHGSSRKSSRGEQEFKDVYEVLELSRKAGELSCPLGSANSKVAEAEMKFIQQRFMDAKRLSTNGKLQDSKEFHDTIEDLNSNQDLLLRFLENPGSMFTKHTRELHCGHRSRVKVSHTQECKGNTEKETPRKSRRRPNEDHCNHPYLKEAGQVTLKASKVQSEEKEKSAVLLPTKIVVLKPNLARVQNSAKSIPSPSSSQSSRRRESEFRGKKYADDIRPSRYVSGESRETVTGEVRDSLSSSISFRTSGVRGYAGDESSSCRSGYESANESDVTAVPSRHSFERSNRYRGSPSRSAESSVSREARKRLSERWKMTHKSVDMGEVSRSSTLGEMLAITDRKVRPANSDSQKSTGKLISRNDNAPSSAEPLGISSRDGWKDPFIESLPRSKSVPTSPAGGVGSPQVSYRTAKESRLQERNKTAKGNFSQVEGLSSRSSRAPSRKSITLIRTYRDEGDTSPESPLSYINLQKTMSTHNHFEQSQLVYEGSTRDSGLVLETGSSGCDHAMENVISCSTAVNPELPADILMKGDSSQSNLEAFASQEQTGPPPQNCLTPVTREPESSASSKEADQPSPVSVLETNFPDNSSSSSDCFESLSADLQGLRLQLKLLKLESETYEEGPMLVSSDEEEFHELSAPHQGLLLAEGSAELSFITEVLLNSGIDDADPNTFTATLHSSECPVSLVVFEELEKKYYNKNDTWPRHERRMLFDQINSALVVINREFNDLHPWVRLGAKIGTRWVHQNGLNDCVYKVIVSRGKRAEKELEDEQVLLGEEQWLDVGSEIDAIGREIEGVLVDELVTELVAVL